jgi:RND family efflux transporter MFP subunit
VKRLFSLTSVAVVWALLLAASGCSQPTVAQTSPGTEPNTAPTADRVMAGHPQRKTLKLYTTQPGRIEAFEETPLYPKVAGYVQDVIVDIGDLVKKDQILVRLSVPEMKDEITQKEALVAQAQAEVKQAEAAVQAAEAMTDTARARVSQAEAGIGRAEGEFNRWKSEHDRIKELAAKGSVTPKLVDETLNQFRASDAARQEAAANVHAAQAGVSEAEANAHKAEADLVAAHAKERVTQANLAYATTMLGYAEIKAPFDGVVTRRGVNTGSYVHPANSGTTTPLMVVARTDKARILVDVPEMEASLVDSGADADSTVVRVQSLGGKEFDANVTRTSWSLDTSNRSLHTEIDIPNQGGRLRPGMYATATILLDQRNDVLVLPITAIVRDGANVYCCRVESGTIHRQAITLGLRSGDEVEIASGLDASQTVVLTRADSLQQGQRVDIIEPQP